MRSLRLTALAALLAATATSAQAGEVRLDDAQLDHVTAGIAFPTSPLLAQVPAVLQAHNALDGLLLVQRELEARQLGAVLGGLLGGTGLPFRLPIGPLGR